MKKPVISLVLAILLGLPYTQHATAAQDYWQGGYVSNWFWGYAGDWRMNRYGPRVFTITNTPTLSRPTPSFYPPAYRQVLDYLRQDWNRLILGRYR